MVLDEIAERCPDAPVEKSLWLRFLLAWLFHESGADPDKKWLFTTFWIAATSAKAVAEHEQFLDSYERSTAAQSALNGICRLLGWERSVTFLQKMRAQRAKFAQSAATAISCEGKGAASEQASSTSPSSHPA